MGGSWVGPPAAPSETCRFSWPIGGLARRFDAYLPPAFNGAANPARPALWIHAHGLHAKQWVPPAFSTNLDHTMLGSEAEAERLGAARIAAEHNAIVVLPQATGGDDCQAWNVAFWKPSSILPDCHPPTADDSGFLNNLTATLPHKLGADPSRVFLSGFSNGGMLVQQLMCDAPDAVAQRVRAVALLSTTLGIEFARGACRPADKMVVAAERAAATSPESSSSSSTSSSSSSSSDGKASAAASLPPMLIVHGTEDPTLPFDSRQKPDRILLGAPEIAAHWAARSGCPRRSGGLVMPSHGSSGARSLLTGLRRRLLQAVVAAVGAATPDAVPTAIPAELWNEIGRKPVQCQALCHGGSGGSSAGGSGAPPAAEGVVFCAVEGGNHSLWSFGRPGEASALVWDFLQRT